MTQKLNRVVKYLALLLMLSIIVCIAIPQNANVSATSEIIAVAEEALKSQGGFQKMMESKSLLFYIETSSGRFAVVDKKTGATWHSNPTDSEENNIDKGLSKSNMQSQLLMEYVNVLDINKNAFSSVTNSYSMCRSSFGNTGSITVSERKDGSVKVLYDFGSMGIKIPVLYSLKKDYFEASVDFKNIDEGDDNRIINLTFLPYFGAHGPKEDGYLFVPDGCGAVAEFNSGIIPYSNYNKTIYGSDDANRAETLVTQEEQIRFPVFGTVVEGKGAMMGTIVSGDGSAKIGVKVSNAKNYYNMINTEIAYRICAEGQGIFASKNNGEKRILTLTNAPYALDKYTIRYNFLSGEDASYVGMAKTYREYLIKEKGLKKNASKPTLALEIYGALETEENFLGINYMKDQKLTSFGDAESILTQLKKSGVNNVSLQYIGWNNDGVYNRQYPTSAKPLSSLGGKKQFNSLVDYMDKNGVEYYFATDLVTFSKNTWGVTANKNSTKTTNGDNAKQFEYSIVTYQKDREIDPWYLLRPQDLTAKSQKFFKSYEKLGVDSVALSQIGSQIYSDFANDGGIFRSKSIEYFEDFVKNVDVKKVAIDGGNSYVVPYATRVFNAPMTSSQYDIFTYDVPFFQMVLHGYVNYTTCPVVQSVDRDITFLKSIETGADLLYTCTADDAFALRETRLANIYSSKISIWKKNAVEYYKENNAVNSKVWDQTITDHARVGEDVFKTVYANGVSVYVNYSDKDQTVDGVTVKAENYVVKEA